MEHYRELEKTTLNEVCKDNPRHLDFINQVFKELEAFNVEEQVEILNSLYMMLEGVYQHGIEVNLKTAEDFKQKLSILRKVEPKNN